MANVVIFDLKEVQEEGEEVLLVQLYRSRSSRLDQDSSVVIMNQNTTPTSVCTACDLTILAFQEHRVLYHQYSNCKLQCS